MKKKFLIILLIWLLCFVFISCSKDTSTTTQMKEGVQPYKLTESDTKLLAALNLQSKVSILTFKAPESARSLEVNTYILNEDGKWEVNGRGEVYIDKINFPDHILEGTFSMFFNDDYSIDFTINTMGSASYKTDKIDIDKQSVSSLKVLLSDIKKIELDKEIPVAIMVYDSGNTMRTYITDDYFTPEKFEEMDLVQAVVLKFTDDVD